jgi:hypothetical protein
VISYASWGSNDRARKRRLLGFQWLPGSVASEMSRPTANARAASDRWNLGNEWRLPGALFRQSQSMAAGYLAEGASAVTATPTSLTNATPGPRLFPAYYSDRSLGEAYTASLLSSAGAMSCPGTRGAAGSPSQLR